MGNKAEEQKKDLIERICERVEEGLPRERAPEAMDFVRLFYKNVPPDDLFGLGVDDLFGAALGIWQFAAVRPDGEARVRVYNPTFDEHGWHTSHTVVEIVNDDMPFLVDSVTQTLGRHGLTVHLLVHPVVGVVRDASGRMTSLYDAEHAPEDASGHGHAESLMHLQVDELTGKKILGEIETSICDTLRDVRAAVTDWPAMRERTHSVIAMAERENLPVDAEEKREVIAFLRWMDDNNFTYLGYREYRFDTESDGSIELMIAPESGLGILKDPTVSVFDGMRQYSALPEDIRQFMRQPQPLMVTKSNLRATVHRNVHLDTVIVKRFGEDGEVVGEFMFAGLFTSIAYHGAARDIPFLRRKVSQALTLAGLDPRGHDGKALAHILNTYPRDELFQATVEDLVETAKGVIHLQERVRTALFVRRDPYGRFISALVYVPRDRYNTDLREHIQAILEEAYSGVTTAFYTTLADSPHARVQYFLKTQPGDIANIATEDVEARIVEESRSWQDRLRDALIAARGEERGLTLLHALGDAFPTSYRESTMPAAAIADVERLYRLLDAGDDAVELNLFRPVGTPDYAARFKFYHAVSPVPLSDVLPMLEHMGFKVVSEIPYQVTPSKTGRPIWVHDFAMETRDRSAVQLDHIRALFQAAFAKIWTGAMEDDGFNRLVVAAGLSWREVTVLRAYGRFLRQARFAFGEGTMESTLATYPSIARLLVDLFLSRFDPELAKDREAEGKRIEQQLMEALDRVDNLNEDLILRRFLNLVKSTLRTNYFQMAEDGGPKPYLSLKFDSGALEDLPLPRPWVEIFVYSPRVEAVHLRGGKVARGGIRWSDRREDFRTEVLGLMKAQMVKNGVIVPVGSKGGFVVKRPPADAGREALQDEGIACYRILMRGMLDITDNLINGAIVPPRDVVRMDADDPYLVVAADKGTATFSDIANEIAAEYGFWLGDAFASGGSAGYDHKKMGITARGAWECVKRHFREAGTDIQAEPFTVVGVGDMSGDVFGNAMLLSPHIHLLGAFNHLHILIDPNPDPAVSFAERKRLFDLGRGSWDQYDGQKLSPGGGIFDRKAKSIRLSPQIRTRFGIEREAVPPNTLIRHLLACETDLLWFGGIGTYVKAHTESHAEVGDKANDALRIDARDLRAKVIGEGANLGVTQRGRIEFARAGGCINTDFIDNSGGVDCSDHEVNIKILLNRIVGEGDMTLKQRNAVLESMTADVALLCMRDNYLQTQALTMTGSVGPELLDQHTRFMKGLEKAGRLNRAVEMLPDDEELTERLGRREGLTRPELAILLSYAKIMLYDAVLESGLPDDPVLKGDLTHYFPEPLHRFDGGIAQHALRREIIATVVVNDVLNRTDPSFVAESMDKSGMGPVDVTRAFLVVRAVFDLDRLWREIEALDNRVQSQVQTRMLQVVRRLIERSVIWILRHHGDDLQLGALIDRYRTGIDLVTAQLDDLLYDTARDVVQRRIAAFIADGVPEALAKHIAALNIIAAGLDLVRIGEMTSLTVDLVGPVYYGLGQRLGIAWLRDQAMRVPAGTHWQKQAVAAIVDDLNTLQADLATRVLDGRPMPDATSDALTELWITRRRQPVERVDQLMAELKAVSAVDLSMLAVANRRLRGLISG